MLTPLTVTLSAGLVDHEETDILQSFGFRGIVGA
jgi:hypothetical protein